MGKDGKSSAERSFGLSSDRINFRNRFRFDLRVVLRLYNKNMANHIDPICGMSVSAETAAGNLEKNSEVYFFCSKGCLETFKQQIANEKPEEKPIQTGKEKLPESEMKPDLKKTHTDSICGMKVDLENAAAKLEYGGETFYFCSKNCLEKFKERKKIR